MRRSIQLVEDWVALVSLISARSKHVYVQVVVNSYVLFSTDFAAKHKFYMLFKIFSLEYFLL